MAKRAAGSIVEGLNEPQRLAVQHGSGPLLVIAGAGSGKTRTLVHRVAWLIESGVAPERILLLTFTRRAAAEMLRRVDHLLRGQRERGGSPAAAVRSLWGGTFHATAARLLRRYAHHLGLDPAFTIHDRGDSEDLIAVVRTELDLDSNQTRFPAKATCLAVYSHVVNSRRPLEEVLAEQFPWCADYAEELKGLFRQYVARKEAAAVLDYDDLLLFWRAALEHDAVGAVLRDQFDMVLVDEYQDTNPLQGDIVRHLQPDGAGLTVVGDDAQSIYGFRAASVRNMLDFPQQFPGTTIVKLEQNYRSTQPILNATNALLERASHQFRKRLWSELAAGERPQLVQCVDEYEQCDYVVTRVLEHREQGVPLREQAVLIRASHHSIVLEAELVRHNIPFVKYGGLKFLEAAHVKDLLAFLRLAENPRDLVAGCRLLTLLDGIGPRTAHRLMDALAAANGQFDVWRDFRPPAACAARWPELVAMFDELRATPPLPLQGQIHRIRKFYAPLLEDRYQPAEPRLADLEQMEQMAARFEDRAGLLADLTLDPPASTQDVAQNPRLDDDYLILSTIHSAKGLEWEAVYVIHAADGNIPSDMASGHPEQLEEERRLLYVALTRARRWLYVCHPQRYYVGSRMSRGDRHSMAQRSRFLDQRVAGHFDRTQAASARPGQPHFDAAGNVGAQLRDLWS